MSQEGLGCCGRVFKFIFTIVNILFLLGGLVIFILAAVLKWTGILKKFVNIPGIEELIKFGSIGNISTAMLIIGAFIILLSLFGILGARCGIKFFLVIYEIIIVLLFLALGISLLVLVFSSSSIEKGFTEQLDKLVEKINTDDDPKGEQCEIMKELSELFDCCGSQSPSDFNSTVREKCCGDYKTNEGCAPRSISVIKKNSVSYLIVPSCVILVIELFAILIVFQMIRKGSESSDKYAA